MRELSACFFLLCIVSLSACDQTGDSVSGDYRQRIERILETDVAVNNGIIDVTYPARRQLKVATLPSVLSIREFLSLRQCQLHTVIAQRNSLIGKVAPSSQLLFNDLQILHHAPACIVSLEKNKKTGLAKKLNLYYQTKQQQILVSAWQAILGERENAEFWRFKRQPATYPLRLNTDSVTSIKVLLKFVERIRQGDYSFEPAQTANIEHALQQLSFGDAGQLLKRLQQLDANLSGANKAIEQRLKKPLCYNGKPSPQAKFLDRVVTHFFAAKVQVNAVQLHQRYAQLMPPYLSLEQALSMASPLVYREWKDNRDQLMAQALTSSKQHVGMLQRLFEQCGITVGR